jgi:exopolysaccharide biosynthesis polyprenyl glycosylphosphotransferase
MTMHASERSEAMPREHSVLLTGLSCCREMSPVLQALVKNRGLFLAAVDGAASFLTFLLAYYVRFNSGWVVSVFPFPADAKPALDPYLNMAALTSALWVFLLSRDLAYKNGLHFSRPLTYHARAVFVTGVYAMVFMVVVSFSFRYFLLSRLVYVIWFVCAFGFLLLARICFSFLDRFLESRHITINRILLMGSSQTADKLLRGILDLNPCTSIVGRLKFGAENGNGAHADPRVPVLGDGSDVEKVYQATPFDQLIVAGHNDHTVAQEAAWRNTLISTLNFCEARGIPVYMVPDLLDIAVRRQDVGSLRGTPLIVLRDASLHPFYAAVKRVMDVVISVGVLILGMPVWLAIALGIKLTSPGPVFYVQSRVGLHGRQFDMFKFRSMVSGADERLKELVNFDTLKEPVFNVRRDPRVTRIGRMLRRTSLDEIPQFLNVLMGSMSVVGPRPERVELVEKYNACQMRRLKAKPGITGYQQVMSRGDPSLARRIEFDLYYLKRQSFFLDVFIILKTILVVIRGDGTK